jgi:Ni/Fe-hydrogenase subunit HybB-like protein
VAYLFAKSIATGALFLAAVLGLLGDTSVMTRAVAPIITLAFTAVTAFVLVIDLERPERFHYILTRSNWRSWLVWGAWFLTAHAGLAALWIVAWILDLDDLRRLLLIPSLITSVLATGYTGFLFAQGLARDLWQGPSATIDLLAQAGACGAGILLIAGVPFGLLSPGALHVVNLTLGISLAVHVGILLLEHVLAPSPTRQHELAVRTIVRGPFAGLFWGGALTVGGVLPMVVSLAAPATAATTIVAAALLALAGSLAWEYIWVEAGQSVPNS